MAKYLGSLLEPSALESALHTLYTLGVQPSLLARALSVEDNQHFTSSFHKHSRELIKQEYFVHGK
jgi:hypothetical protein